MESHIRFLAQLGVCFSLSPSICCSPCLCFLTNKILKKEQKKHTHAVRRIPTQKQWSSGSPLTPQLVFKSEWLLLIILTLHDLK